MPRESAEAAEAAEGATTAARAGRASHRTALRRMDLRERSAPPPTSTSSTTSSNRIVVALEGIHGDGGGRASSIWITPPLAAAIAFSEISVLVRIQ